jgi:hypothetical protein
MDVLQSNIYIDILSTGNQFLIIFELSCNQISEDLIAFATIFILEAEQVHSEILHRVLNLIVSDVMNIMTAELDLFGF